MNGQSASRQWPAKSGTEEAADALAHPAPQVVSGRRVIGGVAREEAIASSLATLPARYRLPQSLTAIHHKHLARHERRP
jgi:hypothetical protein